MLTGASGGAPHALLDGNQNNDTTAAAPQQGDIIVGFGTPATWTRFGIGLSSQLAHQVLFSDTGPSRIDWDWEAIGFDNSGTVSAPAPSLSVALGGVRPENDLIAIINMKGFAVGDQLVMRFNGDNANNYGGTIWENFVASAQVAKPHLYLEYTVSVNPMYILVYVQNSGAEKLVQAYAVENGLAGAGTSPKIIQMVGKWVNAATISSIQILSLNGNNILSGTSMLIFATR